MSDSLVILLDKSVSASEAQGAGDGLLRALIEERIVLPEPNDACVYGGVGYPPGPRLQEIYRYREQELRYWDMLLTCGVKVQVNNYVNFWAFPIFERLICPSCSGELQDDASAMDALYDAVAAFVNENDPRTIRCPQCDALVPADRSITVPDVGLCRLAIEFWNWPPFDAEGWTLSIPELLRERTGRSLKMSWGRM